MMMLYQHSNVIKTQLMEPKSRGIMTVSCVFILISELEWTTLPCSHSQGSVESLFL